MNEKVKVIVKVEYEHEGKIRVFYGKIEETKLDNLNSEDENHILMENDGKEFWKDKISIISIKRLGVQSTLYERSRLDTSTKDKTEMWT